MAPKRRFWPVWDSKRPENAVRTSSGPLNAPKTPFLRLPEIRGSSTRRFWRSFFGRLRPPASPRLERFFNRHASVPFDDESAALAGPLRKKLESQGKVIGPHDLQIAAIALQHEWTLVTSNTDEFSRVEGLKIEDWTVLGRDCEP